VNRGLAILASGLLPSVSGRQRPRLPHLPAHRVNLEPMLQMVEQTAPRSAVEVWTDLPLQESW